MRAISVCLNANLTTGTLKICKIFQICQFCGSYHTISSAKHRVFLQHLTKIKSFHRSNRIQTLKMYHLRLHAVIRLRMKIISVNTSETHIKIPSRTFKCTRRNLAYFCSRRDWWKLALLQTKAWKCGQLGDNWYIVISLRLFRYFDVPNFIRQKISSTNCTRVATAMSNIKQFCFGVDGSNVPSSLLITDCNVYLGEHSFKCMELNDPEFCSASKIFFQLYRQISNIIRTLTGNKNFHYSDVAGASPVGAAPYTSSFST